MGTWGVQTFDNDHTLDWLFKLEESSDLTLLEKTLNIQELQQLGSSTGEEVIAAAEIINAIKNSPRTDLPEEALTWINTHKNLSVNHLVNVALSALKRVLEEEDSELRELWEESEEEYPLWREDVEELIEKLSA